MFKKIAVSLLLIAGLVYLIKVGVADFLRLGPCAYVEAVQKKQLRLDPVELLSSRERLLFARSWDRSNPIILEYLGQIAYMRAQMVSLSPSLQATFLHEAIADFDDAIVLRPNSAYLWADRMTAGSMLLEANVRLPAPDTALNAREFSIAVQAMHRAERLGPWEPKVLIQILRVGELHYDELSSADRVLVDYVRDKLKKLNVSV